jgi:DNA invertase Pin-like site-specific DNA recombinase
VEHQVNLISLQDQLDLSTPEGKRVAAALTSVALYESESRSERILAGQAAARAKGVRWGGSTKGRRLKVTRELETRVKRLQARGNSISQIARETGLSRPTVYRILDRERPYKRKRG